MDKAKRAFAAALMVGTMAVTGVAAAAPGDILSPPSDVYVYPTYGGLSDVAAVANGTSLYVYTTVSGLSVRRYLTDSSSQTFDISDNNVSDPRIAADAAGNFVVVWVQGNGLYPASYGTPSRIYMRHFAANGTPLDSAQPVDNTVTDPAIQQFAPVVAMNGTGQFAIAWSTVDLDVGSSNSYGGYSVTQGPIMMRRYSASGAALGDAQKVADRTSGKAGYTFVAGLGTGIKLLLSFASTGPSISMGAAGELAVAWVSGFTLLDGAGIGNFLFTGTGAQTVSVQRFDAGGAAAGNRITIDSTLVGIRNGFAPPAVALTPDGGFLVFYSRQDALRSVPVKRGYYLKRFGATGKAVGNATEIDRDYDGAESQEDYSFRLGLGFSRSSPPAISVHSSGAFALTWAHAYAAPNGVNTQHQRTQTQVFAADGSPLAASASMPNSEMTPRASMFPNGDYLVTDIANNYPVFSVRAARFEGP